MDGPLAKDPQGIMDIQMPLLLICKISWKLEMEVGQNWSGESFLKQIVLFYRITITKFTLFRESDRLRKLVIKSDPRSKYRRQYGVDILFDLENLLTKGKVI